MKKNPEMADVEAIQQATALIAVKVAKATVLAINEEQTMSAGNSSAS